jgi:hypothetical protein
MRNRVGPRASGVLIVFGRAMRFLIITDSGEFAKGFRALFGWTSTVGVNRKRPSVVAS